MDTNFLQLEAGESGVKAPAASVSGEASLPDSYTGDR